MDLDNKLDNFAKSITEDHELKIAVVITLDHDNEGKCAIEYDDEAVTVIPGLLAELARQFMDSCKDVEFDGVSVDIENLEAWEQNDKEEGDQKEGDQEGSNEKNDQRGPPEA